MNIAGKLKASIKDGIKERKADVLAMRQVKKDARKQAKVEYQKAYTKATISEAKAKAKAKAKRRAEGLKGTIKRVKAKLPEDDKKGSKRDYFSVGSSGGSSPFEIGRK